MSRAPSKKELELLTDLDEYIRAMKSTGKKDFTLTISKQAYTMLYNMISRSHAYPEFFKDIEIDKSDGDELFYRGFLVMDSGLDQKKY